MTHGWRSYFCTAEPFWLWSSEVASVLLPLSWSQSVEPLPPVATLYFHLLHFQCDHFPCQVQAMPIWGRQHLALSPSKQLRDYVICTGTAYLLRARVLKFRRPQFTSWPCNYKLCELWQVSEPLRASEFFKCKVELTAEHNLIELPSRLNETVYMKRLVQYLLCCKCSIHICYQYYPIMLSVLSVCYQYYLVFPACVLTQKSRNKP